jgi:hypothetical protein
LQRFICTEHNIWALIDYTGHDIEVSLKTSFFNKQTYILKIAEIVKTIIDQYDYIFKKCSVDLFLGLFVLHKDVLSHIGYKVNWRKLNEKNHATFLKDSVLKADALCDATLTLISTVFYLQE